VARADGPPGLRGRFVFLGSVLVVLFALTDGPRPRPDSPWQGCGQSALPGRTVRRRLAALLLGSIPPFLSRASACDSRNRS
jgi:hypothetical protein